MDRNERIYSIGAIKGINGTDFTDDLILIVRDATESDVIRSEASSALYKIVRENDKKRLKMLKSMVYSEKDEAVRRDIIMSIGKIGQKEVIPYLQGILTGQDSRIVKISAAYGLGAINDKKAEEVLLDNLKKDDECFMGYAHILGRIKKSKVAVPILLKKLETLKNRTQEGDVFDRMAIIEILGEIGDKSVMSEIKKYINSEDILVAEDSSIALLKLGDINSINIVIQRAQKQNEVNMVKRLKDAYKKVTGKDYLQ